jgi:hypothetical protein
VTAVTFPFRFNFEQARRQAKDLHRSLREDEVQAVRRLQAHHPERLTAAQARLADAQLTVAREHGFESWAKLKEYARPKALYQSEPITDGENRFLSGRHWEDQEARLRRVADEALAKCPHRRKADQSGKQPWRLRLLKIRAFRRNKRQGAVALRNGALSL